MKKIIFNYLCTLLIFTLLCTPFVYLSGKIKSPSNYRATAITKDHIPTIIIDAGHGGEDGGTVGVTGVLEKDINLKISFIIRDMLLASGYDVVMTRSEDVLLYDRNTDYKGRKKALDLAARVKIASAYENSIFVSIHMNSFPEKKYSGLQVYYSRNDPSSKEIADEIQSLVSRTLQVSNSRIPKLASSNIFVLDRITTPAVLVECGFLSNYEECLMLESDEYLKKLAFVISQALQKYILSTT